MGPRTQKPRPLHTRSPRPEYQDPKSWFQDLWVQNPRYLSFVRPEIKDSYQNPKKKPTTSNLSSGMRDQRSGILINLLPEKSCRNPGLSFKVSKWKTRNGDWRFWEWEFYEWLKLLKQKIMFRHYFHQNRFLLLSEAFSNNSEFLLIIDKIFLKYMNN